MKPRDDAGPNRRINVLGTDIDVVTFTKAVDLVSTLVPASSAPDGVRSSDGREIRRPGAGGLVVTANPEMVMMARSEVRLAEALRRARLVVADGVGLIWAARRLGTPLLERVTGIELMDALLDRAEAAGWPVYFLGTRRDVMERAVAAIRERHDRLVVAGFRDGFFAQSQFATVAEAIAASGACLLFIGMGVPREQHFWLENAGSGRLDDIVAVGVGGSFDVLGGAVRRAPVWVQRLNLEWLFRLVREPRRWRRQLALPAFVLAVLRSGRSS